MRLSVKALVEKVASGCWRSVQKLETEGCATLQVRPIFDCDNVVTVSTPSAASMACIRHFLLPSVHRHSYDDKHDSLKTMIAVLLCDCHALGDPQPVLSTLY